jgi:hypothetical protein
MNKKDYNETKKAKIRQLFNAEFECQALVEDACLEFRNAVRMSMVDTQEQGLLSKKINELALKIDGTPVERLVFQLYQELERAGISIKPKTYLSDGWGCPNRVPVIGIPFYLVDPKLYSLKSQLTGIEPEDDTEVMMILRHEAGHAFNYAYRLYNSLKWRKLFGRFSLPYKEKYKVIPFSARFVRHMPGWYVQRHPDDDFAETFSVWLTPGSDWRKRYDNTPAMIKLLYVDKMVRKCGKKPALVTSGKLDMPIEEMTMTLGAWYRKQKKRRRVVLHPILNEDLKRLFPAVEGKLAVDILQANRQQLIRDLHLWTGVERETLIALVDEILERVRLLELKIENDQAVTLMASMSVFVTTLVMNYLDRGQFIGV